MAKKVIVKSGNWRPTRSAITPYINYLAVETSLPPDRAERVVVVLSGITHRGFVRGIKSAIKAGADGLEKYLP
jgi:hypothetical protein